ncbi:acyltransferase domain-containing protein, partial [Streptomyces venezuelae]
VRPDVVVGHSIGEIAAAHVAGVFSLADACRVVGARARLMGALPEGGAMCAVQATPEELAAGLEGSAVSVAAVNTPDSTVISGPADEVERVVALWREKGRKTKALSVSHAFHSALMEPMLAEFTEAIRDVEFAAPKVPLISNVTGKEAGVEITAAEYWAKHVRQAVLFQPAIAQVADRAGVFVEMGPAPVLATAAQHTLDALADPEGGFEPVVTASLRSDLPDDVAFGQAMARLHTAGITVDWSGWFPADPPPRTVDLPTYPFQGRRFWLADVAVPTAVAVADGEEAGFWAAVEGADVQALCDTLHLKDDAHRTALETVFPALSAWRRERRDRSTVDAWRYRVDWRRVDLPAPAPGTGGAWLVLAAEGAADDAWSRTCVRALEETGAPVRLSEVGAGAGRAEMAELIRSWQSTCADDETPLAGVLSLLALDDGKDPDARRGSAAPASASASLALLQGLLDAAVEVPLWCATRGAVSCGDTDPVVSPEQAPVWGFGRVAALEHPELWGGLLDLPADPDTLDPAALYAVLCGDGGEDQVALRRGGVHGRRLVPDAPIGDEAAGSGQPEGAVLVTGGVGGLTEQVVRWLAASGASHVVLLDTAPDDGPGSGQDDRDGELAAEVESHGTQFTLLRVPYESRSQSHNHRDHHRRDLTRALAELTDVYIRTVIHTSLPGELVPLADVTPDALDAATAEAMELGDLAAAAGSGTVDTVLYFSSVAATLGSREHGAYAAANAYLDALAQRHGSAGEGPRTLSVGWGIWDLPEDGDLARGAAGLSRRQGLPPLEPQLALGALHAMLDTGRGHSLVADIEWERFAPLFTLARPTRLLEEVPAARQILDASSDSAESAENASALRRELAALPVRERTGRLLDVVREQVAGVLRYEPGQEVEPDKAFKDLGFDSLVVVELRNRLRAATGLRLPATLVYDYPTPRALAEHLLDRVLPDGGAGELPVAGHLDDLEDALAGLAADDPRRKGLIRRLQTLLWKQPDAAAAAHPADEEGQGGTDDLTAASADDMFALIDREWGTQ